MSQKSISYCGHSGVRYPSLPPAETLARQHRSEHDRMTYDLNRRPPCWPPDTPCPNTCAQAQADRIIRNHVELHGPWAGWRLAGRDPVGHRTLWCTA